MERYAELARHIADLLMENAVLKNENVILRRQIARYETADATNAKEPA